MPAWLRPRTRFTASDMVRTVDTVMEEAGPRPTDGDNVLITSIHRAKGLEWPVVLVPGARRGVFLL